MPNLPKRSRETTNSRMSKSSPPTHDRLALGSRVLDLADDLAHWSESIGALTCTFFADAHCAVARQLRDWFSTAGLASEIDPVGNVVGRLPGSPRRGSHADSRIALRHRARRREV